MYKAKLQLLPAYNQPYILMQIVSLTKLIDTLWENWATEDIEVQPQCLQLWKYFQLLLSAKYWFILTMKETSEY